MLASTTAVHLSPTIVTLLVSIVIPAITALLAHVTAPNWVKQFFTLALSAVTAGLATAWTGDGAAVITVATATNMLLGFLSSTVAYLAAYKPKALNNVIAPNFGIGKNLPNTTPATPPEQKAA